jgi:aspartate aminotransferase
VELIGRRRLAAVPPSATVALTDKIASLRSAGQPVYDLAGGDPWFDTPAHIRDAAVQSLAAGRTHYGPSRGLPDLRAAVAAGLVARGVAHDPGTDIVITPSAKYALSLTLRALLEPGDEVLIPSPGWVSYQPLVELHGGRPVPLRLDPDAGFRLDEAELRRQATPRTRVVLVNSPGNPTGRVLDAAEIAAVTGFAEERDLVIVSDEVYRSIVFGAAARSPAELAPGRTVIIDGVSKAYAMTGWRLGWLAAPAGIATAALTVQQHTVSCAATFVQDAALAALTGPQDATESMLAYYRSRRDALTRQLDGVPGIRVTPPEGAFYAFADIRASGMRSAAFAGWLLDRAGVAVVPGAAFGPEGDGHVRVSLAAPATEFDAAVSRLADALRGLATRDNSMMAPDGAMRTRSLE